MPNPTIRPQETEYWKQHRRSSGCQANFADRRSGGRRAAAECAGQAGLRFLMQRRSPGTTKCRRAAKAISALRSVSGGFGGGVHAGLGGFADAAGGGPEALALGMVQWV